MRDFLNTLIGIGFVLCIGTGFICAVRAGGPRGAGALRCVQHRRSLACLGQDRPRDDGGRHNRTCRCEHRDLSPRHRCLIDGVVGLAGVFARRAPDLR